MEFAKLLSGRVVKVTGSDLSPDRYDYIKVSESEPDFGHPSFDNGIFSSRLTGERRFLFPSTGLVVDNTTGNITVDFSTAGNEGFSSLEVVDTDVGYTWSATGTVSADTSSDTIQFVSGDSIDIDADTTNDAIRISHGDTSLLNGIYGTDGIKSITVDENGHVTELTTATFLTTDVYQDVSLDSTDANQYITFVENTSGAQTGRVDTDLTYNPSSNLLTVGGSINMSGDLSLGSNIVFEGATADAFETTLTVTDPTADRTITLQDGSGTLAFLSDLPTEADTLDSVTTRGNTTTNTINVGGLTVDTNTVFLSKTTTIATTAQTPFNIYSSTTYVAAKILIQANDTVSGERQMSEFLVIHDGSTAKATEYGIIFTGASAIAFYDVDVSGGNVRLLITGASANSTEYKITEILSLA